MTLNSVSISNLQRRYDSAVDVSTPYFGKMRDQAFATLAGEVGRVTSQVDSITASLEKIRPRLGAVTVSIGAVCSGIEKEINAIDANAIQEAIAARFAAPADVNQRIVHSMQQLDGLAVQAANGVNNLSAAVNAAGNQAGEYLENAITGARRKINEDVFVAAENGIEELSTALDDMIEQITDRIEEAKDESMGKILEKVESLTELTREEAVAAIQEVVDEVVKPLLEEIRALVEEAVQTIVDQIQELLGPGEDGAGEVASMADIAGELTDKTVGDVDALPQ